MTPPSSLVVATAVALFGAPRPRKPAGAWAASEGPSLAGGLGNEVRGGEGSLWAVDLAGRPHLGLSQVGWGWIKEQVVAPPPHPPEWAFLSPHLRGI